MKNNEQIAADLENNCSDYYYCMNGTKQVIRKIYRDELGKLYVTLPNWGTVPLERCPETLIRRVPTLSLEDTDDKLKERLRLTAQILVAEVGADGPMNAEDVALKAVELIKSLRDEIKTVRKAAQALEAEVERLKGDRSAWAARSQEQFDRIGVALERVREHRYTGEPSRDDATEIEALVEKVIKLEIESGHWIVKSVDLEKEVTQLKEELERMRRTFLECAHCKCAMLVSTEPPCCNSCTLDEEDVEAWEKSVLGNKHDSC